MPFSEVIEKLNAFHDAFANVILRFHFDFYFSCPGCPQRTVSVALCCLLGDGYSLLSRRFDI